MRKYLFFMMFMPLLVSGQESNKYERLIDNREYVLRTYYMSESILAVPLTPRVDIEIVGVETSGRSDYFLKLKIPESNTSVGYVAFISYEDLVEINYILQKFQKESEADLANKDADEIRHVYVTDDKFAVGCHVEDNRVRWFIKLDSRLSATHVLCKKKFIDQFVMAQKEIEDIKNNPCLKEKESF